MTNQAQLKANARYLSKKKTVSIRLDPIEYDNIKKIATESGESVQGYILTSIRQRIDNEHIKLNIDEILKGTKNNVQKKGYKIPLA